MKTTHLTKPNLHWRSHTTPRAGVRGEPTIYEVTYIKTSNQMKLRPSSPSRKSVLYSSNNTWSIWERERDIYFISKNIYLSFFLSFFLIQTYKSPSPICPPPFPPKKTKLTDFSLSNIVYFSLILLATTHRLGFVTHQKKWMRRKVVDWKWERGGGGGKKKYN